MTSAGPGWPSGPPPLPVRPPAADRLVWAAQRRHGSDYRFSFWTALGWTLLSCGIFGYYVDYQLVRRMRDHNLRRLELLEAAYDLAWERAAAAGRHEELRPRFERASMPLATMRAMTGEFRDPVVWLVLILVSSGIAVFVVYWLLDGDLVKHSAAEAAAEWELAGIYAELGAPTGHLPPAMVKSPHQFWLRIVATLASCGLYGLWWLYDLMQEPNRHFERDWAWEDAFLAAVGPR